jgi:dihydrolipoamide dehydrogenase
MERYDLIVIGGGPSGYAAAMRGVDFKKKVLLIEKEKVGGAGVYNGALTSKTYWELSRQALAYHKNLENYSIEAPDVPFAKIRASVEDAVQERKSILEGQLEWLKHLKDSKFHYIKGSGSLISKNEVQIEHNNDTDVVHGEYIVLATGSRPRAIQDIPIDEKTVVTSDGIHNFQDYPKSLLIVGAGVIGCEFATIFSNFGNTEVHIIARDSRILPFEDPDITSIIEENLEKKGVIIHRNTDLNSMKIENGRVHYETISKLDGKIESFEVEKALISIGRVPNIEGLGLGKVGVEMNNRGHILDNDTQTNIPNIYAVGDLTADIALVNVGELEGRYAVEKAFGHPSKPMMYDNISTIMFLTPETAGVGMNEQMAQKQGINYKVVSLGFDCIPRAIAMRKTQGFFKILVTDDDEMKILGMRALGEHASSAIQAVALLISTGKGIEELAELIHPHPSIIEGVQECVRMFLGKSIIKPGVMNHRISCRRYAEGKYSDWKVLA